MHPSTAQARVIVDELCRARMRHIVVCPGSRNAPLSMAAHEAGAAGRVSLHVRIDERSAGFLALGLATALGSDGFAAVVCTSGTAAANLHPAVLEAHHARTPLLVLTADRPGELYDTGANQTIRQRGLYGPAAGAVDLPLAERRAGANAVWRGTLSRAVALAVAGPVQVNVPLREPLVPDGDPGWPESLDGRADGGPWTRTVAVAPVPGAGRPSAARTVLVVGDPAGAPERITAAARVAAGAGWPVVAEPTGVRAALAGGGPVLASGSLLLNAGALPEALRPDEVVVAGRPTLTRGVGALLRSAGTVRLVGGGPDWTDPQHVASEVVAAPVAPGTVDPAWAQVWRRADDAAVEAVDKALTTREWPTGPLLARALVDAVPSGSALFLGSSNPVRFVDLVARPRPDVRIVANRGVAGIDGSVSTAAGLALGGRAPHTYAFLGDLTFLHDVNGLLIGPEEERPDLTVVVLNDDGGGIFSLLEQGAPEHAASFERVFGTPHGADLAALCRGYGAEHTLVRDADHLAASLEPRRGVRVLEVRATRERLRDEQAALHRAVAAAVAAAV